MTREEHRRAVYIVGSATRNKRPGLLLLCSGPECGGAEVFVPGLTAAAVAAATDAHIDLAEPDAGT